MRTLMLTIIAAVALSATAYGDPRNPKPDWVDGSSMEYPREKYLTGVGIGDDRASAEDRARAEISKIFSTQVSVNTNLSESESSADIGGKKESSFSQSVSQTLQTASKKALEGVDVVETWQDSATRQYYALAVLDRAKAILAITDKLGEIDKQAQQWSSELSQSSEKLPKVKAGLKLLALLKAREELNGELRVLDAGGKTIPSPFNDAEVRPKASKAISELDVLISMSGENSHQIETGIIKGLTAFGLQAKAGGSEAADIVVDGAVEAEQLEGDGSRWKWARSTATLTLKDGRTSKIFLRFEASDRQASADYREALRRSQKEVAKKVAQKINEGITSYFENQ